MSDTSDDDDLQFRKEALDRISIPDELNILFQPVQIKTKIITYVFMTLAFFATIWIFFGSIPILLEGIGIVINKKGLFSLQSKTNGIVDTIYIKKGQILNAGDKVALIVNMGEDLKYETSLIKLKKLEEDVSNLRAQIEKEKQANKKSIEEQIVATKSSLTELEKSIPPLEQELASKEELFKEGLLGLNNLHETRQLLSQRKIAIEVTKGNLATLEANLSKSYREQELREKERNLLEQLQQNEILKLEKKFNTVITPSAGRVLDILVKSGNHVQAGTPLVRMEYSTDEKTSHLFLAFVPLKYGKSIDVGSQVTLELATIKAEEYGSILGRVKEVSLYPISQAAIQNTIQNEGLVKYLTLSDKYLMEVIIEPELDPATPTGYKWTSGTGPDTTISSGTTFFVKGIIARTSPLYYFFSLSEVRRFEGDIKNLIWKE